MKLGRKITCVSIFFITFSIILSIPIAMVENNTFSGNMILLNIQMILIVVPIIGIILSIMAKRFGENSVIVILSIIFGFVVMEINFCLFLYSNVRAYS